MDFDTGTPIWRQLLDDFSRRITSGAWARGSQIPSVRDLSAEYGVNPNTMQKALTELERTGLVASRRGLGRFVTEDAGTVRELGKDLAKTSAHNFITDMKTLGLSLSEAQDLLNSQWKGRD